MYCRTCGTELSADNSYQRKDSDKLRYICKDCYKQEVALRKRNQKKTMVDYKGGKCEICGYDKCIGALEFHHLNPDEKELQLSSTYRSWEKQKVELDKCILVCANCHREIHSKR